MAREGLIDDTGYHGFDIAEDFFEEYCTKCARFEECKHIVPCDDFEEEEE